MNKIDKLTAYLLLKTIDGVSDRSIIRLVDFFDDITKVFNKSESDFKDCNIKPSQIESILLKKYDEKRVEEEIELIKNHKIEILYYDSENYPSLLKEISSPPVLLYSYGNFETFEKPSVAIVGARNASNQALNFTSKLSEDLGESGFNIVSGFASGIDIKSHLGAIKKGFTTCVLGNGFLQIYPKENKKYLNEILKKGCIITEFSMNTKPEAHNFPRRNRIISGMSLGVIVVEAAVKSGSLITAKYALEQNREVFAVPTHPFNFQNATNKLIKDGAVMVENYQDVVETLIHHLSHIKTVDKDCNGNNIDFKSDMQKRIYDLLSVEPVSADYLGIKLSLPINRILNELAEMELSDIIALENDGKYYLIN